MASAHPDCQAADRQEVEGVARLLSQGWGRGRIRRGFPTATEVSDAVIEERERKRARQHRSHGLQGQICARARGGGRWWWHWSWRVLDSS